MEFVVVGWLWCFGTCVLSSMLFTGVVWRQVFYRSFPFYFMCD